MTNATSETMVTTEASQLGPMQPVLARKYLASIKKSRELGSLDAAESYLLEEAAIHHGLHLDLKDSVNDAMLEDYLRSKSFYALIFPHFKPALALYREYKMLPRQERTEETITDIVIRLNNEKLGGLYQSSEFSDSNPLLPDPSWPQLVASVASE